MSALVIFDLDGTVLDTEHYIAQMTADLAQAQGCALDASTAFRRYAGLSFRDRFNQIAQACGRSFSNEQLREWHRGWKEKKRALYASPVIPLIAGAPELIGRLSANPVTLAVATSNPSDRARTVLATTGLSSYFADRVYGSDMANGRKKPDPLVYQLAMGGHGPEQTLVVEDSIPGVQAAHAAGAFVVAYLDPRMEEDRETQEQIYRDCGADLIISDYNIFEAAVMQSWAGWPKPERGPG